MPSNILCDNLMIGATIYSEDTLTNFGFENAINASTALQVGFQSGANRDIIIDFGISTTFDCIAIAKHNLWSSSSTIKVYSASDVAGPFNLEHTLVLSSDNVHMQDMTQFSSSVVKLEIQFPASNCYAGNISIGKSVQISDGQYIGFKQPNFSNKFEIDANVTRGGEISGIIRKSTPIKTKIEGRHLTKAWMDSNWENLRDCISKYPFYFRWDDNEASIYCWAKKIDHSWSKINKLRFQIDTEGFI